MVSNHKKEAVYRFFGCIVLRRPFFISTSARDIFSISEIKEDDTSPALLVNQSKIFVHCNAENCGLSSWRMKYLAIGTFNPLLRQQLIHVIDRFQNSNIFKMKPWWITIILMEFFFYLQSAEFVLPWYAQTFLTSFVNARW